MIIITNNYKDFLTFSAILLNGAFNSISFDGVLGG